MFLLREKQKLSPTERLMRVLPFHQEDLTANQKERLSPRQKFSFRSSIVMWSIALTGAFLIVIGGTLCGHINRIYGIERAIYFLIITMLTPLTIDLALLYRQQQRFATGHVEAITGYIKKPKGSRKHNKERSHLVVINDAEQAKRFFEVRGDLHDAFIEGEIYTVYVWSFNERQILSAEHRAH